MPEVNSRDALHGAFPKRKAVFLFLFFSFSIMSIDSLIETQIGDLERTSRRLVQLSQGMLPEEVQRRLGVLAAATQEEVRDALLRLDPPERLAAVRQIRDVIFQLRPLPFVHSNGNGHGSREIC